MDILLLQKSFQLDWAKSVEETDNCNYLIYLPLVEVFVLAAEQKSLPGIPRFHPYLRWLKSVSK